MTELDMLVNKRKNIKHEILNLEEIAKENVLMKEDEILEAKRKEKSDLDRQILEIEGNINHAARTNLIYLKDNCKGMEYEIYRAAEVASIIGDTVGDPLKDTSGPSLNILVKLSSIISLVFAPLFLKTSWIHI